MSEDIVRADPVWRRRLLWGIAGLAAVGAAAIWLLSARLERGIDLVQARRLLRLVGWALSANAACAALFLVRLGVRVLRSGRYPPPGTLVLRDTVVRTGAAARALAWLAFACAAALVVAAAVLQLFLARLLGVLGAR